MSLEDKLYPWIRLYERAPAPLRTAAGALYRALPARLKHGAAYGTFQREAADVLHWSKAEVQQYQVQSLRDTLHAAWQTTWYQQQFEAANLRPDSFHSLGDLRQYPLLTKGDILAHGERMVNPGIASSQRLSMSTGGSTGEPVSFFLQKGVSRPKEQAYLEAQWNRRGWKPGERMVVLRGHHVRAGDQGDNGYLDASRNWLILSSSHLTPERMDSYWREITHFGPLHLHAYPSSALLLAQWMEAEDRQFPLPLHSVLCGSEKLDADTQAYLERIFGTRVLHWYGHSERAVMAAQGRHSDALYFWPTYGYVEFGQCNDEGAHEIIATSFHNHAMPLIRYRTGDYAHVMPEEATDREYPWSAVQAVAGRSYEFLLSRQGRRVSLTTLNRHDTLFHGLYGVQFVQHEPGLVQLRYLPGPAWQEEQRENLRRTLLEHLGADFELQVQPAESLEKTRHGKSRWLVSSLAQSHPPTR